MYLRISERRHLFPPSTIQNRSIDINLPVPFSQLLICQGGMQGNMPAKYAGVTYELGHIGHVMQRCSRCPDLWHVVENDKSQPINQYKMSTYVTHTQQLRSTCYIRVPHASWHAFNVRFQTHSDNVLDNFGTVCPTASRQPIRCRLSGSNWNTHCSSSDSHTLSCDISYCNTHSGPNCGIAT